MQDATKILSGDIEASQEQMDASTRRQSPIFVGVIKHQNRVLVRTRDIDAMNEIRAIHKRLDMESSMLLMEVKVLSIDLSDGYDSLFDFKLKGNNGNLATGGATDTVGASQLLDTGIRAASAAIANPAMLATVVSNNFEARLQLLENENRVTQLATPMLLTSNQEVSSFLMGSTIPVLVSYTGGSTTTTGGGINSPAITQTLQASPVYEQRTIGNTLLLTPSINSDNTVSVQIVVEEAALIKNGASILVPVTNAPPQAQLIDIVNEKTFSGSVIAKSGTAVAVGGIIQESAGGRESKVPILGDIPGLGFFFREEHQTRARTELVIIIKPHIINSPVEAESISQEMLANNSVHPSAVNAESLDIYSNADGRHKGYVLEQPYKEYSKQDAFDKYRDRGDSGEFSRKPPVSQQSEPTAIPANQQVYVDLTRYASKAVLVP
ncbi:MAG: type II secretion system protein GspD, partial [Gammaproteobacteria bacterium]